MSDRRELQSRHGGVAESQIVADPTPQLHIRVLLLWTLNLLKA